MKTAERFSEKTIFYGGMRMKKLKRGLLMLIGISFLVFLAAGLASCAKKTEENKVPTIMYVSPKINDPVWLIAKAGFEAAAVEYGFNAVWGGADDHTVEKTVEALENIIVQQPDAIVTCPFAPAAFTNALKKAKEAGIVVTCAAVDAVSEDLRTAFVGTDLKVTGVEHIQKIISLLPPGTEVRLGALYSNLDAENQNTQVNSAEEYMKANGIPHAIVDRRADNADPNIAVEVVTSMLRAHPGINAIMSTEGGGTPGVGKALEEMGLQNKVVAICMDGTELNIDQVKNGRIAGVMAQNVYRWGYDTAKYAYLALQGEQVPSITNSGVTYVDKTNANSYDPLKGSN
jgi:ABC-type sugar transport system substrate-binding protein